jgi:hypothetical protein
MAGMDAELPGAGSDLELLVEEPDETAGGGRDPFGPDVRGDLLGADDEEHGGRGARGTRTGGPRDLGRVQDRIFDLPPGVVQAVDPWLAARRPGREELRREEFGAQFWAFLEDVVARDMYADRSRPVDERQYDFSEWIGAEFSDFVDEQAARRLERERQAIVRGIAERLRLQHPEMADAEIQAIVGEEI